MAIFNNTPIRRSANNHRYSVKRNAMVDRQIAARGIKNPRVLKAMRSAPRHRFVPPTLRPWAYDDRPLHIGEHQTISQPYMVAAMTEALDPLPTDRILEVGTGSGYQAAVLAELVESVVTIERFPKLADRARKLLDELGYDNVEVIEGDGTLGYAEGAPYDGIIVTAGAPHVSEPLTDQLAVGGVLVCPVGSREMQKLLTITRTEKGLREEEGPSCLFVPLVGEEGW